MASNNLVTTDFFVKMDVSSDDPVDVVSVREEMFKLLRASEFLDVSHVEVEMDLS